MDLCKDFDDEQGVPGHVCKTDESQKKRISAEENTRQQVLKNHRQAQSLSGQFPEAFNID